MLRRPAAWLRAISECRATVSGGPGFAYDACVDRVTPEEIEGVDLSTWRVAYVGGDALSPTTLHRFANRFERQRFARRSFVPCYGLAEATLFVAGRRAQVPPTVTSWSRMELARGRACRSQCPGDLTTVGHRLPPAAAGIDIRIVDPGDGGVRSDGEIGEICVSSGGGTDGYFTAPTTVTPDGMLRTGDLGFVSGGELHVLERLDDTMRSAAGLVCAHEIEDAVRRLHPLLAESVAFAVPGVEGDELVIVQGIRTRTGADVDMQALKALVERIAAERFSMMLRALVPVPARHIRRTTSGKVQRQAMRDEFIAASSLDGAMRLPHADLPDTFEHV
jgi:acyl-CoA synthetase (AMP-forming)/AMP-acid ligase II